MFVAVLTVNWDLFANIAAASFDVSLATLDGLKISCYSVRFLFVAIAGAIIRDPAFFFVYCGLTPGVYLRPTYNRENMVGKYPSH